MPKALPSRSSSVASADEQANVEQADSPAFGADKPEGAVEWAASLATSVGNRALSRVLAPSSGRTQGLLRQPGAHAPPAPPAPTAPAPAPGTQQDPSQQGPQPTLDPEAAKKLLYAQTVLSKVRPLPEGEKANLNKMVEGSDLMNVIEHRDKARADLAQAKTDLESARDISGAEKDAEMKKAQGKIDTLGLDLEGLQVQIDEGLKKLGVASEEELVALVAKFPETWKKQGKEIAGRMLDENKKAAEEETKRYDVGQAPQSQASGDVDALREADLEISHAVAEIIRLESPTAPSGVTVTLSGLQADVDRGPPAPPPKQDDRNQPLGGVADREQTAQQARNLATAHEKKVGLLARWRALGMAHVFLFHPSYQPGSLLGISDEKIGMVTGQWAAKTKENIEVTRENINDETIALWDLRDVPDLTFDSLGVPRDSVLGKAVEKEYADKKSDEEGLKMAAESFAMTLTVLATAVAGPVGLAIGAAAQGIVSVAELAHDLSKERALTASQNVALDPELAKMSTEDPDIMAVVMDLASLGFAIGDAVSAAKGIRAAVKAFEASGNKEIFISEASKIIGEKAGPLAEKVAVRARAYPEGFMQVFEDYRSAHNAYMDALKADPTREVGIWRNRENNKYVMGYGSPTRVEGPASTVDKAFELVKHHHPGDPVVAGMIDRVPSVDDFQALMAPRHAQVDASPVRSMISWVDEGGTMHYTTFGMDPTELERYWVRYTDESGQVITKRFKMEPWSGSKVDYVNWIESLKGADLHGAPSVRP